MALIVIGLSAATAQAGTGMSTGIQDDTAFGTGSSGPPAEPTGQLPGWTNAGTSQVLGSQTVRIFAEWWRIAPINRSNPCALPSVSLDDPGSYDLDPNGMLPNANLSPQADHRMIRAVNNAAARGLRIFISFTGPFPCYASLGGSSSCSTAPQSREKCTYFPDPGIYRKFVTAVAARIGSVVNRWSPYNEPNNGENVADGKAGFLNPQTQNGKPTAALIYRSLYFNALAAIQPYSGAPLWFGDVQTGAGMFPEPFVKSAFCFNGTNDGSGDLRYPSCTSTPTPVKTEALTFHTYVDDGLAEGSRQTIIAADQVIDAVEGHMGATLVTPWATGVFTIVTESGVHHNASVPLPQTASDPLPPECNRAAGVCTDPKGRGGLNTMTGQPYPRTEEKQAAYINCMEEAAYRNAEVQGMIQYVLQDPTGPQGAGFYTGIRAGASTGSLGMPKQSYNAWRFPLTAFRLGPFNLPAAQRDLRVWGAYRPQPRPATVLIEGLRSDFTAAFSANVPVNQTTGYFDYVFSAATTPVPTGLRFRASAGGIMSRIADGNTPPVANANPPSQLVGADCDWPDAMTP